MNSFPATEAIAGGKVGSDAFLIWLALLVAQIEAMEARIEALENP